MSRENRFKWRIEISTIDTLKNLYQILTYHILCKDSESLNHSIYLEFVFDESESKIHEDIKAFVDTRKTNSKLVIQTEGEEDVVFDFPMEKISDLQDYESSLK